MTKIIKQVKPIIVSTAEVQGTMVYTDQEIQDFFTLMEKHKIHTHNPLPQIQLPKTKYTYVLDYKIRAKV